ncbi:MAG: hypothetical protein PUD07_01870 [bacterium]|nr:hypothetical protein [bacterium]
MKKVFKIIKIFILIFVICISFTSSFIYESKIYNNNPNKKVDEVAMALKINEFDYESLYGAKDTLVGDLTGYAYNCPLCSGKLACLGNYNITNGTTTFNDETYGNVMIVASSTNLACGTIVRFSVDKLSSEPILAIVLDRGVRGNNLDLLSISEEYAINNIGRVEITYDVLRKGW